MDFSTQVVFSKLINIFISSIDFLIFFMDMYTYSVGQVGSP